ncbi:MAG: Lrp/AsnC family transcriptional regulator [bacterium]|nr:Lrp/AsnC family transcriptional regulator [bacterium]
MERTLDRTDFGIIAALQNDARLSNKELANRVHLAPSSCLERVRRLREAGVLTGFHARVEPKALGIGLQAMIAVRLDHHSGDIVTAFQDYMLANPAVIATYYLAGKTDFLLHVAVRDAEQLRSLAVDYITARPEVNHVETSLIFEHRARPDLPRFVDVEGDRDD